MRSPRGLDERWDVQLVTREVVFAIGSRAEQAADVGAVRVYPVFMQVATGRGTADVVVLLQSQHVQPRFCQVGRIRQTVVPRADDNCIVGFHHSIKPPFVPPRWAPRGALQPFS